MTTPPAIKTMYESGWLRIATAITITRTDGVVLGFSTFDQPLTIGGVVHEPLAAITASAVERKSDLSLDNLEVGGGLESDAVTDADISRGLYDRARIEVGIVKWDDLAAGRDVQFVGRVGDIRRRGERWVFEVRGVGDALQKANALRYLRECNVRVFGDTRCGVDVDALQVEDTVSAVSGNQTLTISDDSAAGYWRRARVTWLTGANAGYSQIAAAWEAPTLGLLFQPPGTIQVGDTLRLRPHCDRSIGACKGFSNFARFRGYPHMPGQDDALDSPESQ